MAKKMRILQKNLYRFCFLKSGRGMGDVAMEICMHPINVTGKISPSTRKRSTGLHFTISCNLLSRELWKMTAYTVPLNLFSALVIFIMPILNRRNKVLFVYQSEQLAVQCSWTMDTIEYTRENKWPIHHSTCNFSFFTTESFMLHAFGRSLVSHAISCTLADVRLTKVSALISHLCCKLQLCLFKK